MKHKKPSLIVLIAAISFFCGCFYVYQFDSIPSFEPIKLKESGTKTAHVYVDFASISTLFQMVDALTQNPKEPKLMFWKRFHALKNDDRVLKSINANWDDLKFLGEYNYGQFASILETRTTEYYSNFSDYHFVIHLNAYHVDKIGHLLDIIPKENIKAVHLYDDSIGRSLWDETSYKHYRMVSKDFPTYFHLKYFDPKILPIEKGKIVPLDFTFKLSENQRKNLAKMVGLNFNQTQKIFKKRPVAVFLDDPDLTKETAESFIKNLINKKPEIQSYTWLYKNHPRVSSSGPVFKILSKYFKNVIEIPNAVPLETLILIGFSPDYITGYGSSVFYSFPKEKILGYIHRIKNEDYQTPLINLGILTPELVFNIYEAKGKSDEP